MNQNSLPKTSDQFSDHRVLILAGEYAGEEGICLGAIAGTDRWAVSPDCSTAVLDLRFESDFALLL